MSNGKYVCRNNMDAFVRFANLLMNDATFLLDESLTKLAEIYNIQAEMDKEEWRSKPQVLLTT